MAGFNSAILIVAIRISVEAFIFESKVCPESTFPCGNTTWCLHQMFQCDGTDHCGNNADEENCDNDKGIVQTIDKYFPANSQAENVSLCALSYYPPMCTCKRLTNLVCKDLGLTEVPREINPNVTTLILMKNELTQVSAHDFAYLEELETLYLSHNKITDLAPGSFQNLTKLSWLFLDGNQLASIGRHTFDGLQSLRWLNLSSNKLATLDHGIPFKPLEGLAILGLNDNNLQKIKKNTFKALISLESIDLSKNKISKLEKGAFDGINLTTLNLSSNHLQEISSGFFLKMHTLQNLDLSRNPLIISDETFEGLGNLEELALNDVDIPNINSEMFQELMKIVKFKRFRYCKYARNARNCYPKTDGISTYANLLGGPILRISVWTIAFLTMFANIGVFVCRLFMNSESRVHSIVVSNLCASDYVMGVYLFVIGIQDARFHERYYLYALDWSESVGCMITGSLAIASTEASVFSLVFISVERYFIVAFPYHPRRLSNTQAIAIIIFIWIFAVALAGLPLALPQRFGNFYGSNGVCFPLHIHDPFVPGWQYSAFLFLGINALCFMIIIVAYIGIYCSIKKTKRRAASRSGIRGDMGFAKCFFFIVVTDCLCWLPLALLKIKALCHHEVPEYLYAWLVIFVLPINSALNPILYTISTESFKKRIMRNVKRKMPTSSNNCFKHHLWKTEAVPLSGIQTKRKITNMIPASRVEGVSPLVVYDESAAQTKKEQPESKV